MTEGRKEGLYEGRKDYMKEGGKEGKKIGRIESDGQEGRRLLDLTLLSAWACIVEWKEQRRETRTYKTAGEVTEGKSKNGGHKKGR